MMSREEIAANAAEDRDKVVPSSAQVEYGHGTAPAELREVDPSGVPRLFAIGNVGASLIIGTCVILRLHVLCPFGLGAAVRRPRLQVEYQRIHARRCNDR